MKKFIFNLFLFGTLFFIYDKVFLVFENYSAEREVDRRLELLITGKMNKDIIVLGASRGANNIIAGDIEKMTGCTAYNMGYPATDVEFHEFILRALLKYNKPPKIILFPLDDPVELLPTNTQDFRYERLYPLVKYKYINQEMINRDQKNAIFSKLFVLHRINKTNLNLRQKRFTPEDTLLPCGSMPIAMQRTHRNWVYEYANTKYTIKNEVPSKINALKKIIAVCRRNHIKLIFITTPNYRKSNKLFESRMREFASSDVPVYEYNKENPIYYNKNYFYDESHLNKKGAKIFTHEIGLYLNQSYVN